ncbi:MAG: molybdenum cofactor biosynthesis protein MoaE [Pseudomonadota bacterium]
MILVAEKPLPAQRLLATFEDEVAGAGAIASFVGKVRDRADGEGVTGLTLEHHPILTHRSVDVIAEAAQARWSLLGCLIAHRVGHVRAGEAIVLVAGASIHRRDAFAAVDFMMDHLKSKAYFWKKEHRASGTHWIEPRPSDAKDLRRWTQQD